MKKRFRRVLSLLLFSIFIIIISFALYIFLLNGNRQASAPVFNSIRTIVNPAMDVLQDNYPLLSRYDNFRSLIMPELAGTRLEMQVADLRGNLIFNSSKAADNFKSVRINLSKFLHYDLSFMNERPGYVSFAFPVIVDGSQQANALFIMPEENLNSNGNVNSVTLLPVLLLFLTGLTLLARVFYSFYRDYVMPVRSLGATIPKLIRGDLNTALMSAEKNEMGEFIRALDLMRLELKDSLEMKNRLEAERKELVASISHEIKTPLASVKAYAEGLRDGLANDPETMKQYAGVILSKTDSLIKLVNDLLQHALQDLGSLTVNLSEHYSGSLLRGILEPIQLKFSKTAISLEIEGEIPDVLINADPSRLEQVLANLIQNAEKYAPEGGKITVGAVLEDGCVLVTVSDNGSGIPPEELPFIFDRHYRGKKASQSKIEGSGLGLSICKYIIERHGGTIFAESAPGGGSRFRFTIPKI